MKEKIKKFLEDSSTIKEELKKFVMDKSIPLKERWDLFIESKLGDHSNYIVHFNTIDDDLFGPDEIIRVSKYETITVEDICVYYLENKIYPYAGLISKQNEKLTFINLDEFKEEVLEKFIYSFTFDW